MVNETEKAIIRERASSLPVTAEYPFDVEAKLLRSVIAQSSVMLDIGANAGIYSTIMEDIVGSENLYIFEPLPHLHRVLKKRFANAHVFDLALSDKEEIRNIRVPLIEGARVDARATFNSHTESNQTGSEEVAVQLLSLDSFAKVANLVSLDLIKIDVEGHELEVINGGVETIARFKPLILIEIESRHHKFPITEIFARFASLGYEGYYLNPSAFELFDVARFDNDRDQDVRNLNASDLYYYLNNFFFVHKASANNFVSSARAFLERERTQPA
ncbi:MAG: FkbM family methyltransferase [Halioglobus sp.]|nr:FkbM family methyltransferase [Halioglobus sp.]